MGQKNFKGAVSVANADGRIRLRWRYSGKRYSISLSAYSKQNLREAKKVALLIEQDIINQTFDFGLNRYKGLSEPIKPTEKSFTSNFEEWTCVYKQMDCELHTNYNSVRNMLRKWGKVEPSNILVKFNAETFLRCNLQSEAYNVKGIY